MTSIRAAIFVLACAPGCHSVERGDIEATGTWPSRNSGAPLHVSVRGPTSPSPGTDVDVHVRIERTATEGTVDYEITLPDETSVVSGALVGRMREGALIDELVLVLHLTAIPRSDVMVVAETRAPGFGARARGEYRFGRVTRRLSEPLRAEHDTKIAGRTFGRAIRLDKTHAAQR